MVMGLAPGFFFPFWSNADLYYYFSDNTLESSAEDYGPTRKVSQKRNKKVIEDLLTKFWHVVYQGQIKLKKNWQCNSDNKYPIDNRVKSVGSDVNRREINLNSFIELTLT